MLSSRMGRRLGAAAIAAAMLSAIVAMAAPANATPSTGGESGVVLLHSSGSLYAGPHAFIAQTTVAGGSVTYAAQIKNTGSASAQFLFRVNITPGYDCSPGPCAPVKTVVMAGTSNVSSVATGPNGYFTPVLHAGATMRITVKITVPASASPGALFYGFVELDDTAGTMLNSDTFQTNVAMTTGTTSHDMFVKASGGRSTGVIDLVTVVSGPVSSLNDVRSYVVTLANDSAAPTAIIFNTFNDDACVQAYPYTVMSGTTDVTAAAASSSGYTSKVLAPGASTNLRITITTSTLDLTGCYVAYDNLQLYATDPVTSDSVEMEIVTNPAVA